MIFPFKDTTSTGKYLLICHKCTKHTYSSYTFLIGFRLVRFIFFLVKLFHSFIYRTHCRCYSFCSPEWKLGRLIKHLLIGQEVCRGHRTVLNIWHDLQIFFANSYKKQCNSIFNRPKGNKINVCIVRVSIHYITDIRGPYKQ